VRRDRKHGGNNTVSPPDSDGGTVAVGAIIVELRLLGPPEVREGDRAHRLAGKQGAILVLLGLEAGRVVSSERLVDELWGEAPPESALKSLDVYVWRLRRALPALRVEKIGRGYRLELADGDHFDLREFERLVAEGRAAAADGDPRRTSRLLSEALRLWSGPPLAGLDEPFARAAADRLADLRLAAVEERIAADLDLGGDGRLAAEVEALVGEEPLRESLRALQMRVLYRAGRQADALAAYQEARRTLVEELGIEPSPALQQLERAILQQDPALDRPTVPRRAHNLPEEATTFVGRERDLERLASLLGESAARLLTLTGSGGSGKTRLALRAAREVAPRFEDGVVLVELAPLSEASLVVRALAAELGVQESAARPLVESLATNLAAKHLLLVLDNFEHVAEASLDVVRLLSSCPRLHVLVTSRVPLRVQGEQEIVVPPLELPPADAPMEALTEFAAIRLFDERARAIRSDFAVGGDNAEPVAAICSRLDGLPLAIELVAARTRILSPEAILPLLERRLDVLDASETDRPGRQRTLRDSIEWSHDLLGERERTLFRRLAIFRGGCTLAAAETVCGGEGVFAALTTLVEHGLVTTRWATEGESRFDMLETIAEFARERLAESGELDEVGRRHAEFLASFAEEVEPQLLDDGRTPWLRRLDDERDNIRAALARAVEQDEAGPALRILGSLWLWYWRSFAEGFEWGARVLALPSGAGVSSERAGALFTAAICATGMGDAEAVLRFGSEGVEVARTLDDDKWLAFGLAMMPGGYPQDVERGMEFGDESIAVAERTGDAWLIAWMRMIRGLVAINNGESAVALERGREAVEGFDALGDSWSRSSASVAYGLGLLQEGEFDGARDALRDSVATLEEVGDLKMANTASVALGFVERLAGDEAAAGRRFEEALRLCVAAGDPANAPVCLAGLASVTAAADPPRATRLLGAARALLDSGVVPIVPGFELFYEPTYEALSAGLGDDFAPLFDAGRADAASGRALTPEMWAGEPVATGV
jgi:predicted ATPase/DNA-binding SARP family transcriptional activator